MLFITYSKLWLGIKIIIISLNIDTLGKFSINYFINPHLKELIGESLGDAMEKTI